MIQRDTDRSHAELSAALLDARERMGWSLVQVAERMHLDVATVRALEAGQFDSLGATVYARGHLRRYAELLGLPAAEIERICAQASRSSREPDLRHTVGSLQDTVPGAWRPATAAIGAVVLVLLGLVWWAMRLPGTRAGAGTSSATANPAAANSVAAGPAQAAAPADPAAAAASAPASADLPPLKQPARPGKLPSEPAPGGPDTPSPQSAPSPAAAPPARAHAARP